MAEEPDEIRPMPDEERRALFERLKSPETQQELASLFDRLGPPEIDLSEYPTDEKRAAFRKWLEESRPQWLSTPPQERYGPIMPDGSQIRWSWTEHGYQADYTMHPEYRGGIRPHLPVPPRDAALQELLIKAQRGPAGYWCDCGDLDCTGGLVVCD